MFHNPRLRTYGYWGQYRPSFAFTATAKTAAASARRRPGALQNLRVLGVDSDGNPTEAAALILRYSFYFDVTYNTKTNWTADTGTTTYLENPPSSFRGGVVSLFHSRHVIDTPSAYHGYLILKNMAWTLRFRIFKPPQDQLYPLSQFRWGRYQFQIADGQAEIMRLAEASDTQRGWSQTEEDTLNTKLAQSSISSADQTIIDDIKKNIYADTQSLSLGGSGGDFWYNTIHTLTFWPENGRLHVVLGGPDSNNEEVVANTDIQAARSAGTMWDDTPLYVRCRGGAYEWQVGRPNVISPGVLRLGQFGTTPYYASSLSSLLYNTIADTTPAGTGVTVSKEDISGTVAEILATLTGSGAYTPYLYALGATIEAGDRDGDTAVNFDTNDHLDGAGNSPIMELAPNFDGCNRRVSYDVTMRDPDGSVLEALGDNYSAAEQHMVTLTLGANNMLTNGIVYAATRHNMNEATAGTTLAQVTRPESMVTLTLHDQYAILEEYLMREGKGLILDGRILGDACRAVLKCAGIPAADMAFVSASYGMRLPQAVAGEDFAVYPQADVSAADLLRELLDQYGFGALLYQSQTTGIWTLADAPTTTKVLNGHAVAFSSSASTNSRSTYPGRYVILEPLDMPRELSDFYNELRVEGANDAYGVPLAAEWRIQASIVPDTPTSKYYIGRVKRMRTVTNTALRTMSAVQAVLRSLKIRYGLPPFFHSFKTYYFSGLYPGDLVTVDGVACRIERINSGSLAGDTMDLLCRETGA